MVSNQDGPSHRAPRLTLRAFIVVFSLIVSFVSFGFVLVITFFVYDDSLERTTQHAGKELSHQISHYIPLLMAKGWTRSDLLSLYNDDSPWKSQGPSPVTAVELYRTAVVEELYGASGVPADPSVTEACATGSVIERKHRLSCDTVYPLAAGPGCLSCHPNARSGDILGAVRVRQDMEPMAREAGIKLFGLFLFLSPIPLLMAMYIARLANNRVVMVVDHLRDKVADINNVRDLTTFELTDIRPGFAEFGRVFHEIGRLVDRIRNVSIDKEVLEFEIQILEKFIITSEVVRDWKEHVGSLLLEINKVLNAYALFCIFQVEEEQFEIEIFWRATPSASTREKFEETVLRKLSRETSRITGTSSLEFSHTIADHSADHLDLTDVEIDLQTKSLILTTPQIGGVVGIGVQSEQVRDNIRSLVIDSILTTLLNVVGSIKAIYKYTRDLEYYATRDPLTNLYNQRVFWDLLGYEINRSERTRDVFSLLVIDLDNFKNINDSYGHITGDKYLVALAAKVREALRKGDIFARYGGDEFAIILHDANEEQAYQIADRIREFIEELHVEGAEGGLAKATASIGLAVYPVHARTEKDLFMFADNMTYKAKGEGKNRVTFPTEEDVIDLFRKTGEKARMVMQALEEKRLTPYFQPIVPMRPGLEQCCEVLCRLETGDDVMTAGEFIEVAENLGVMGRLDLLMMEKSFALARESGYRGNLFVNISPKSVISGGFMANIVALADSNGIDHARIVFELTERETVKNLALLEKFVHELKAQGFKFAIDDFGSGFSSFQYIRLFPIDFVKIEGIFVQNMLNDYRDMAFVKTLTTLAREFRICSIAEYIETEDLLEAVREVGIDYVQGFHIGRPAPLLPPPLPRPE